jgi:hypothetical protein
MRVNAARPSSNLSQSGAPHRLVSEAGMDMMRKLLARFAALPIGTTIAAAVDFGPVIEGQSGIVTHHHTAFLLLGRPAAYGCIFLGGVRVMASRAQITAVQHGHSLPALEDPFWFLHSPGQADRPLSRDLEARRYISRTN